MAEQGSQVPTFSEVFGLVRQSLTNKQSQNPTTLSVKPRILREEPSEQESEQESDSINNPFTDDSSDWEPQPSDEDSSSQSDLDSTRITKKEERKLEPQPSDEESSSQSDLNSSRKTKQEERKLKSYPAKKPRSSQTDHDSKRKTKKRKWKSYPAKKPRSSQTDHDSKRKTKKRKWEPHPSGGHSSVGLLDLHSTRETKKDDTACESRNSYKQQSDDNYVSDSNSERSAVSVEYPALSTSQFDDVPPIGIQQKSKNWDKYHSCCFCNKMVIKIARHLEKKHVNETGVAQVLLLAKGSSARRKAWVKLMNDGDYQHNFEVLERGRGTIIPRYRRVDMDVQKIVPCPTCKGMYRRNKLATHSLGCRSGQKGRPYKEGSLMLPVPPNIPKSLWENVLLKMRDDEVATNAKKDDLIVAFGERIYNRRDVEEHTADHVSGRMRELSRLVLDMKRESGNQVCTLSDALQVKNFDDLIKSVRNIAQYSDETHTFKKGSLARKLGYSVQTCATILKSKAIQNSNKDGIENATNFLSLFSGNWTDHISAVAGQSLEREKFNKPRLLPCCKDVQKLYSFVKDVKTEDYPFLAKAAICEISLFNRKRGGEIQRMTLDDLEKGKANNGPADEEIMQSLTAIERKLVQTLKRIEIRGKFNRRVAILLTDSMMAKIDKIVNLREELSISSKYIFATPNGERPYRGSDAIRLLAVEAEVSNPEIFTWTALRKQVATISQAIEISDLEQDQLAQFLGHDIRVHRDFYRLPHDILQKAKVAKILLRINEGKNVSTKDLVVDENVELEPELDNSDNSDDEKDGFKEKNCGAHASKEVLEDNAEQSTKCRARKSASQRRKWNEDEKRAVLRHLSVFIGMKKVPGKSDIEKVLKKEKCLQSRTWTNIKDYCYNEIKKM